MILGYLGQFADAVQHDNEALREAEASHDSLSHVRALTCLGLAYLTKGDLAPAGSLFEQSLSLASAGSIRDWSSTAACGLALTHALSGRLGDALPLAERALETATDAGFVTPVMHKVGQVYRLAGRLDEATRHAQNAVESARQNHERGCEALALSLLGDVTGHHLDPLVEQAVDYYRQALVLAEPRGMRPLVAHCHLGLGKLYRRTGKREQAQEHLTTATTMYREMGMRFWLEKAEAETRASA